MKTVQFDQKQITPSKIICVGRNYVEHIKELNNEMPTNMVLFNKPNSALSSELLYRNETTRYEGEICFVIENKTIVGIGFGLDLTQADIQNELKKKGLPWERAKSFDGSAVLGNFVAFSTKDNSKIRMELFINDTLIQHACDEQMIYKPDEVVHEIESFMSLEDGDIIMSGTPKGVGNYKRGDIFRGNIYSDETLLVSSKWSVI